MLARMTVSFVLGLSLCVLFMAIAGIPLNLGSIVGCAIGATLAELVIQKK